MCGCANGHTFKRKTMEIWKAVEGSPRFEISSLGRCRFLRVRGGPRILKGGFAGAGYKQFCVGYAHRLVAQAFIPNPKSLPWVNHKNGIKTDNRVENLEWCTPRQNTWHAIRTGLHDDQKGAGNYASKLTDEKVRAIRAAHTRKYGAGRALARQFGVSPATISLVVNRKLWSHIT